MNTYLSLLRGINVSGQKKVPMAELKSMYEKLGYEKVKTYIQSGNVVFQTKAKRETLCPSIEKAIEETFHFEIPVIHKTTQELRKAIHENPFLKEKEEQENKLYICFLFEIPAPDLVEKLQNIQNEEGHLACMGDVIYLYLPEGYGKSKLNNNFIESKLKIKATTRNWRSANELLKLMENI